MARIVHVSHHMQLEDYAAVAQLATAVAELRAHGAQVAPRLRGRTVWMVNSTAQGGGVAEMLPAMISLLRELGLSVEWLVMEADDPEFFALTKRIHNLIHGVGDPEPGDAERSLYDRVSEENAAALREFVRPTDVLVIHDPQPLGAGALLKRELDLPAVWRCHIGLEEHLPATRAAWRFLEPYASAFDAAVFSAAEYIPSYLAGRAHVIHPAIDPLTHKNRELSLQKLVGILCDASLARSPAPLVNPPFPAPALRLQRDGSWLPATEPKDFELLYRPTVTQISRWDRLKGFGPLLDAFVYMKTALNGAPERSERHRRTVELTRLALAGPAPTAVADDPEATEVLEELSAAYLDLPEPLQEDVALLLLPMGDRKRNALMVNALQRTSTIVVQNSIQEGFGLTASEAMWKRLPVVGTKAHGLRIQIRNNVDGCTVADPEDRGAVARIIDDLLGDERRREQLAERAERRVHDEFLIFRQLERWLTLLAQF